ADYDIHVYKGTNDMEYDLGHALNEFLIEVIPGSAGQPNYSTTANLEPGWYTLVAISKNTLTIDCRSVPLQVEIKQDVDDPVIVANQIDANMYLVGISPTRRSY